MMLLFAFESWGIGYLGKNFQYLRVIYVFTILRPLHYPNQTQFELKKKSVLIRPSTEISFSF